MKKIFFYNVGCRTNVAEIEEWILNLDNTKYIVDNKNPDLIILNTCAVTNKAGAKSRSKLRDLKKKFPNAEVIPIGCAVDNGDFDKSSSAINNDEKEKIFKKFQLPNKIDKSTHFRSRYNLLIQLGCNSSCTYCIIPTLRGKERSLDFDKIVEKAFKLLDSGIKELVLSGTNIGRYHFEDKNLYDLMKKILEYKGTFRLRLSSIEAWDFDTKIIDLAKEDKRICPFFHIPIQSGSSKVLKDMNRLYKLSDFKDLVKYIKERLPDSLIGTDIIVAFPTETDELFEETYEYLRDIDIEHFHVFPYSSRKNTFASLNYKDKMTNAEKKERVKKLINLGNKKKEKYLNKFLNKKISFIVEKSDGDKYFGKTDNFIDLETISQKKLTLGELYFANIKKISKGMFFGSVIDV